MAAPPSFVEVAEGDNVDFNYTVTEKDVNELLEIIILIRTSSRYHRYQAAPFWDAYDDKRNFVYSVNPPDED